MAELTKESVKTALSGPVSSIRIPFYPDGRIDLPGLRKSIDFNIAAESKTMLLTYGDSLYSVLTDQEISEVTKTVVEHTAGRALVVAADRHWGTTKECEFARYLRSIAVDMLMVLPPDWAASCTTETFVDHYTAVAEIIPVMIVTGVFGSRPETGLKVIEILRDRTKGVMAIKDDICGEFARKMGLLVHDTWAVISGGQKQNHLNALPYGCDGYLSAFITFLPQVVWAYWKAIESKNLVRAAEIIGKYEMPFFNLISSLPGGFDAGMHGTLELFGIAKRWRRKPYYSLNDAEMERLAGFFKNLGGISPG